MHFRFMTCFYSFSFLFVRLCRSSFSRHVCEVIWIALQVRLCGFCNRFFPLLGGYTQHVPSLGTSLLRGHISPHPLSSSPELFLCHSGLSYAPPLSPLLQGYRRQRVNSGLSFVFHPLFPKVEDPSAQVLFLPPPYTRVLAFFRLQNSLHSMVLFEK